MKNVLSGLLLVAISLSGQVVIRNSPSLIPTLRALENASAADRVAITGRLVGEMMSLTDTSRAPERQTVQVFADDLTRVLIGRKLTEGQLTMLQTSMRAMLRGSTTNLKSTNLLRDALADVHVDSSEMQSLTRNFLAIGEDVRGPDDSPLLKFK